MCFFDALALFLIIQSTYVCTPIHVEGVTKVGHCARGGTCAHLHRYACMLVIFARGGALLCTYVALRYS